VSRKLGIWLTFVAVSIASVCTIAPSDSSAAQGAAGEVPPPLWCQSAALRSRERAQGFREVIPRIQYMQAQIQKFVASAR